MTVKKALELLNLFVERNKKMAEGFSDPSKSWNRNDECTKGLAHEIADLARQDLKVLELIKKELHVNCKHPKKMRDRTKDGQWYCMNCNMDLDNS